METIVNKCCPLNKFYDCIKECGWWVEENQKCSILTIASVFVEKKSVSSVSSEEVKKMLSIFKNTNTEIGTKLKDEKSKRDRENRRDDPEPAPKKPNDGFDFFD